MTLSDFHSWETIVPLLLSFLPFLLILLFFLSLPIVALILRRQDSRKSVQSAEVQIVELYHPYRFRHGRETYKKSAYCSATFETPDGQLLKFQIPPAKYGALTLDAHGILTYRGRLFLNFRQT